MSGGHYDYKCYAIEEFATRLKQDLLKNDWRENHPDNVQEMESALMESYTIIQRAAELAHAVEWLMGDDYSGDTFLTEFKNIMERKYKLNKNYGKKLLI